MHNHIPKTKFLQKIAVVAFTAFLGNAATADVIDFKAMAEPGGLLGESIWNTLTINGSGFQLDITGTNSAGSAYAYLDAGNAGLGVCGAPKSGATIDAATNSGTNQCNPASDDNVTTGEALQFVFDVDVLINDLWLNNNHDDDKSLYLDTVNIGGSAFTFTIDNGGPANYYVGSSYFVAAGDIFEIAFNNEQFYVSGIDVSASVPEPSSMILFGLGLLGLGLASRRKKAVLVS